SEKWAWAGAGRPSVSAPSRAVAKATFVATFFIFQHLLCRLNTETPGVVPLGVPAQEERGSGHRRRTGHKREGGVGHLACRGPAHLPHRLGHQVHPLDVTLGEATARRVGGQAAVRPLQMSLRREWTRFTGATEAVGLERQKYERCEGVVDLDRVDVGRCAVARPEERAGDSERTR